MSLTMDQNTDIFDEINKKIKSLDRKMFNMGRDASETFLGRIAFSISGKSNRATDLAKAAKDMDSLKEGSLYPHEKLQRGIAIAESLGISEYSQYKISHVTSVAENFFSKTLEKLKGDTLYSYKNDQNPLDMGGEKYDKDNRNVIDLSNVQYLMNSGGEIDAAVFSINGKFAELKKIKDGYEVAYSADSPRWSYLDHCVDIVPQMIVSKFNDDMILHNPNGPAQHFLHGTRSGELEGVQKFFIEGKEIPKDDYLLAQQRSASLGEPVNSVLTNLAKEKIEKDSLVVGHGAFNL